MFAGRLASGAGVRDVASAARRTSPSVTGAPRDADLLLDALATRFTDGYDAAVGPSRAAVRALRSGRGSGSTPSRIRSPEARRK